MEPALVGAYARLEGEHWWWLGRRAILLALLDRALPDGGRLLDVGCGTGALLREIPPRFVGFGVDADARAVQACREAGLSRVSLVRGEGLPFADGSFDAVLALDVLEHLDSEAPLLAEARRVLRPGGALLVTVPALGWLWSSWDEVNRHRRRYARGQLARTLEVAGFAADYCSYMNFLLFPAMLAGRFADLLTQHAPGELPASARIPAPALNRLLAAVFGLERAWLARDLRLPWGSSLVARARPR